MWIGLLIWSIGSLLGILPAPLTVQIIGSVVVFSAIGDFFLWIFKGIYRGICAVFLTTRRENQVDMHAHYDAH